MSLQNSLTNYSFLTLLISLVLVWASSVQTLLINDNSSKSKPLKKNKFLNNSSSCPQSEGCEATRTCEASNGPLPNPRGVTTQTLQPLPLRGSGLSPLSKDRGLKRAIGLGGVRGSNAVILNDKSKVFELSIVLISNFLLTCILILRWKESGHFPLSNLYESLMFLSWCFTAFYLNSEMSFFVQNHQLFLQNSINSSSSERSPTSYFAGQRDSEDIPAFALFNPLSLDRGDNPKGLCEPRRGNQLVELEGWRVKKEKKSKKVQKFVGFVAIPCALLCNAFARFTLPKEMQEASPLVPALQSNWLMMHVSVIVLSYALLILGSLMSILFLIVNQVNFSNFESEILNVKFQLDNLSYRILALGFPLLTIGILSGAVWANEAWGSYWSWDPKETWALLTWLVFAVYLHTRLSKGWQGKKPAVIASFGFFIVWMCYLGVNLIGEGLHSYGWIVKV